MEDERSLPRNSIGMESVVATVSGYHGSERFHLIKLLAQSGASYVGAMNQSTTHLVCLKHEGRKYELAKEFGIFIVNHQWVEECVKRGRRVSEQPYILQSGREVGPLVLDVLFVNGTVSTLSSYKRDCYKVYERPEIDVNHEVDSCFPGDHWFQNKNMISERGPSISKSHNTNKKEDRRSNLICSTSSSSKKHTPHESKDEELFSLSTLLSSENRKSPALPESHCKGRRLVKKNVIDLDSERGSRTLSVADQLDHVTTQSNGSNKRRDKKRLRYSVISDDELVRCDENRNESSQEMANIHTHKDTNLERGVAPTLMGSTSKDLCSNVDEKEIFSRPAETTDYSCVICLTNFSSSRGVLSCGHRFCFSCIENWANMMASKGKASTCPLCKASFISITKVEGASSSDQKIFSQTIPYTTSIKDIFILSGEEMRAFGPQTEPNPVCSECSFREPEDLLVKCHLCHVRCVHSYCLDPPLLPWTCIHCKDLQMMYRHLY